MAADLRTLRKHLGMTQEQLAAAIGTTRKSIGEYERGVAVTPRQTLLATLCLCLWAVRCRNPNDPRRFRQGASSSCGFANLFGNNDHSLWCRPQLSTKTPP
jgi:DNA-binding XRE family transcriptional regulator